MLELPAEEISPERNRPTDRRNFRGRHRHRHSGSLVFLLPDRATSHSDSCESASYRLMRTDRTALIRIGETIKRHLSGGYLVDDCKNKRDMINFLDESRGGQD
jgi:hypothetical protein